MRFFFIGIVSVILGLGGGLYNYFFQYNDRMECFQMLDFHGNIVNLNQKKPVYKMLYFGFTRCPDVCPYVLSKMHRVLNDLKIAKNILNSYFITLDLNRDSLGQLYVFLKDYNNFIGLLPNNRSQLQSLTNKFGVYAAKMSYSEYFQDQSLKDVEGEYMINHTSVVYIVDRYGHVIAVVDVKQDIEEIKRVILDAINVAV